MTNSQLPAFKLFAATAIRNESCSCDMGMCQVTAQVIIQRTQSETLMNDPTVKVGNVDADVVEQPGSPVESPPGTFTHTFNIAATGLAPGTHEITAQASLVVGVPATPVDVNCS